MHLPLRALLNQVWHRYECEGSTGLRFEAFAQLVAELVPRDVWEEFDFRAKKKGWLDPNQARGIGAGDC